MSGVLLYVDEDASENAVIAGLRARGFDLQTTAEAGRLGSSDEDQLSYAVTQGRAIYTFNVADFAELHREYLAEGRHHHGIIVIPDQRYSVGEKVRRLAKFLYSATPEGMTDRMEYL